MICRIFILQNFIRQSLKQMTFSSHRWYAGHSKGRLWVDSRLCVSAFMTSGYHEPWVQSLCLVLEKYKCPWRVQKKYYITKIRQNIAAGIDVVSCEEKPNLKSMNIVLDMGCFSSYLTYQTECIFWFCLHKINKGTTPHAFSISKSYMRVKTKFGQWKYFFFNLKKRKLICFFSNGKFKFIVNVA